jgi:hypothetical protein
MRGRHGDEHVRTAGTHTAREPRPSIWILDMSGKGYELQAWSGRLIRRGLSFVGEPSEVEIWIERVVRWRHRGDVGAPGFGHEAGGR